MNKSCIALLGDVSGRLGRNPRTYDDLTQAERRKFAKLDAASRAVDFWAPAVAEKLRTMPNRPADSRSAVRARRQIGFARLG